MDNPFTMRAFERQTVVGRKKSLGPRRGERGTPPIASAPADVIACARTHGQIRFSREVLIVSPNELIDGGSLEMLQPSPPETWKLMRLSAMPPGHRVPIRLQRFNQALG